MRMRMARNKWLEMGAVAILLVGWGTSGLRAEGTQPTSSAPAPWPRYKAAVSKDRVNLRVEPSLKGRLAPSKAPKGTALSVQRAADAHWFEILEPDEYRGFFLREDMITLGSQE